MKKNFVLLCTTLILLLMAFGCQDKAVNEKQIIENLPKDFVTMTIENPFTDEISDMQLTIDSLEIEKRQTNEKDDTIYCIVKLSNEYFEFTKYIRCYYVYYDKGGWILENWDYYQDETCKLIANPFPDEKPFPTDSEYDLFAYYYTINECIDVQLDNENNCVKYTYNVEKEDPLLVKKGQADIIYSLVVEPKTTGWTISFDRTVDTSRMTGEWKDIIGVWSQGNSNTWDIKHCTLNIEEMDMDSKKLKGSITLESRKYDKQYNLEDLNIECLEDELVYTAKDDKSMCISIHPKGISVSWGYWGVVLNEYWTYDLKRI